MITVSDLEKKFDKRGIAGLNRLSFTLKEGEVMGIMGPNGSGKTTLLNILSGKLAADGGSFKTDGKISFFPSIKSFDEMNVQKFLVAAVTLEISDEKKIQLARDLADTFEFTFQLRQNLSELSSGQRQKILLAAELINQPSLLLMDEPFAHLDPFTRKDILSSLFKYIRHQGITVLWVTHELEEAFRFSDLVGVMNFGKLEQLNTPVALLTSPRNLFVAQFVGYQNFFPIKKESSSWATPWGQWEKTFDKNEAIMVIPDRAFEKNLQGIELKVEERFASRQGMEYILGLGERRFSFILPSQEDVLELNSTVNLIPKWDECFLISL